MGKRGASDGPETKYSWGNGIGRNRANCDGCGSQWDDSPDGDRRIVRSERMGSCTTCWGTCEEWVQDWLERQLSG